MSGDVTQLLNAIDSGDPKAAEELLPLVYSELRPLASAKMAQEKPGQTLQPTALVHEAWLRLGGDDQPGWQSRGHFFAAAAEAMRRILVDRARSVQRNISVNRPCLRRRWNGPHPSAPLFWTAPAWGTRHFANASKSC